MHAAWKTLRREETMEIVVDWFWTRAMQNNVKDGDGA
jgi:hypothetical protein